MEHLPFLDVFEKTCFFSQIFQFFGRKPVDFRENLVLYREGTSPGISASTTSTSWRTRRRGLEVPQNGRS